MLDDHEEHDDEPRKPVGCGCTWEMPGRCPGRVNCPAFEVDDEAGQNQGEGK